MLRRNPHKVPLQAWPSLAVTHSHYSQELQQSQSSRNRGAEQPSLKSGEDPSNSSPFFQGRCSAGRATVAQKPGVETHFHGKKQVWTELAQRLPSFFREVTGTRHGDANAEIHLFFSKLHAIYAPLFLGNTPALHPSTLLFALIWQAMAASVQTFIRNKVVERTQKYVRMVGAKPCRGLVNPELTCSVGGLHHLCGERTEYEPEPNAVP